MQEHNPAHMLWILIGTILFLYGVIIGSSGLYFWFTHADTTVLENLHPNVWWGLLLMISGALFNIYAYRRNKKDKQMK